MNNKQVALIMVAIIVGCSIIAFAIMNSNVEVPKENNTTIKNITEDDVGDNATQTVSRDVSNDANEDDEIVRDENGIMYNKRTGICVGQNEGQKYSEAVKMYDSSSPNACPHGMADPSYCPACS